MHMAWCTGHEGKGVPVHLVNSYCIPATIKKGTIVAEAKSVEETTTYTHVLYRLSNCRII